MLFQERISLLRRYSQQEQEHESEAFDQPSQGITEETSTSEPAPSHVDDVTSHYFGMLKYYQPAPGAPDNKSAQLSRDAAQDTIALAEKAPEIDGPERDTYSCASVCRGC